MLMTSQTKILDFANMLQIEDLLFICKYNITDPVWTSASLQMMGGEGEFAYVTKAATFYLFPMHP